MSHLISKVMNSHRRFYCSSARSLSYTVSMRSKELGKETLQKHGEEDKIVTSSPKEMTNELNGKVADLSKLVNSLDDLHKSISSLRDDLHKSNSSHREELKDYVKEVNYSIRNLTWVILILAGSQAVAQIIVNSQFGEKETSIEVKPSSVSVSENTT